MEIQLWGVRGSIPNPSQANRFYGANTTCIEVRTSADDLLILDAGTGIRSLSRTLPASGVCHVFVSHGHDDHIQGLTFFQPLFLPNWTVHLYLPKWLMHLPEKLFDGMGFPLLFSQLRANIKLHEVEPDSEFTVATQVPVRITAMSTNHPGGSLAYRMTADDVTLLYSGDHEITEDTAVRATTRAMLHGVTTAVVDAAFSRQDYIPNWGHSSWEDWVELAKEEQVNTLLLTHHTQDRSDTELDALQEQLLAQFPENPRVILAREGMMLPISAKISITPEKSDWLNEFIDSLSQYKEESILLERILSKTREITRADAGTIFLIDGDEMFFAYAHNDTLFPNDSSHKSAYVNMRLPITTGSIAGYTAATGQSLNLPDVHNLPTDVPYGFNASFDEKTGYHTKSILTVPIVSHAGELLGVIQLINSLDPRTHKPRPFTDAMEQSIKFLAREAATFLEIGDQVRGNIKRLLQIAMLHDPTETGPHAERVGAIVAEIYQLWAEKHHEEPETIRYLKGQLRLAAMLHDIGKVGISDLVLKKNGKLTDEEFDIMRGHTTLGATLFSGDAENINELAHVIALHHHQKWNGKGYPSLPAAQNAEGNALPGGTLSGEQIPLGARITAIADVYDALVSPRCYKEPWSKERARALLVEEAGQHFDAELVECFLEMPDVIDMIYERFPDATPPKDDRQ